MPAKDPKAYDRQRHQERRRSGLCINCAKVPPAAGHIACETCRTKQGTAKARLIRQRKAKGLCYRCGKKPPDHGLRICSECNAAWRQRYRTGQYKARYRAVREQWRRALKREVFNAYGGCRCVCCDEQHMEFLTLDHINGDGKAHREKVRARGSTFYGWVKRNGFPPGFRVLCMNCNFAIGHFGRCPHEGT